jgi:hypothetical protein
MNEDKARDAVEHLQAAAREVGAAVRAFIDAVGEADVSRSWASVFDELAKGFGKGAGDDEPDDDDDGFERIKVD